MVDIKINFAEIDDIHKAAEMAKTVMESGENVLVSHRPTSPSKVAYRKWFRGVDDGGSVDAGLIEKDMREGCQC
jgi:hypothetical protein